MDRQAQGQFSHSKPPRLCHCNAPRFFHVEITAEQVECADVCSGMFCCYVILSVSKTFTMDGGADFDQVGINSRALEQLFSALAAQAAARGANGSGLFASKVRLSAVEVYNEAVKGQDTLALTLVLLMQKGDIGPVRLRPGCCVLLLLLQICSWSLPSTSVR
jgi:hypothetical protein